MCNGGPDFREMGRIILYFLAMKMGSDSTRKKKKSEICDLFRNVSKIQW